MTTHKRVKFREYCQIKRRLKEGMPIMKICAWMNRSPRIIDMVRASVDFNDYKRIRHERSLANNSKYRQKGGVKMKEAREPMMFKAVTKKDFDLVKTLLAAGVSRVKTGQIAKRSYFTVTWLDRASSFEDYKTKIHEYSNRTKEKETLQAVGANFDKYAKITSNEMPKKEVSTNNNEMLEVLKSIDRNLSRLADAWEAHPTAQPLMKRLFNNS